MFCWLNCGAPESWHWWHIPTSSPSPRIEGLCHVSQNNKSPSKLFLYCLHFWFHPEKKCYWCHQYIYIIFAVVAEQVKLWSSEVYKRDIFWASPKKTRSASLKITIDPDLYNEKSVHFFSVQTLYSFLLRKVENWQAFFLAQSKSKTLQNYVFPNHAIGAACIILSHSCISLYFAHFLLKSSKNS